MGASSSPPPARHRTSSASCIAARNAQPQQAKKSTRRPTLPCVTPSLAQSCAQTNLTLGDRATAYSEVWLYNVTINFAPLNASGNASANDTGSVRTNGVRVLRRRSAMARAMAFRLW